MERSQSGRRTISAKLTCIITVGALAAFASLAKADVYTDPVGFTSYSSVPSGYSFWGLNMTTIPSLRGIVGTPSGNQLPVNSTLTANQYTADGTAGHIGYYIEITSGPNAGLLDDIVSNSTTAVFTANDDSALISNGQTFKLYQHWTPNTVLGSPAVSGLTGGANAGAADNVIVWNPVTQTPTVYYWRTSGTPGWRGPQGSTTDAGTNVWYLDAGIQVYRRTGTTNYVNKLVGAVKLGPTIVPIAPGPSGYTFASYVYASSLTMNQTGLFTTNSATGVLGGANAGAADNVIVWDPNAQSPINYYWRTSGTPGWRGPQGSTTDAGTNSIPIGSILQVFRRTGAAFNWTPQQPY